MESIQDTPGLYIYIFVLLLYYCMITERRKDVKSDEKEFYFPITVSLPLPW